MSKQEKYDFTIIFEKVEKAKKDDDYPNLDMDVLKEINNNMNIIEEYANFFNEIDYETYYGT